MDQLYKDTEDSVKLEFLRLLLEKNEGLRNQFLEYCKPDGLIGESHEKQENTGEIISETCENLKDDLEALNFEDIDWEDYRPRHSGYIPEYEAIENIAEDQLNEIFDGWKDEILSLINNGQSLNAVCTMLGAYDACLDADIPGSGDVFGDITETLLQNHHLIMNDALMAIKATIISGDQAFQVAEVVLDHYQRNYSDTRDYLKYFEPFMITLVENGDVAERILATIQNTAIDEALLPGLVVKLYSFLENPGEWVKKAEQFLYDDLEVAKQLLDYYWQHDAVLFLVHGKKLFTLHPHQLCDFFRERLFPMFDLDFFKDVLLFHTLRDKKTALYEELREYLDDAEKQRFIDEIAYDEAFRVKVLEMEQRYQDILDLATKEVTHTWHFSEMITPLLNIYPAEVMNLIRVKTSHTIQYHKGRDSYQRVCEWLRLSLQIKGKEEEARHLIHELYNRRPALPALKDEMRRAGVVG